MSNNNYDSVLQQAQSTKEKWDNIIKNNIPFKCKKCWLDKLPVEFCTHYYNSQYVWRYRILLHCKECHKQRVYKKRWEDRETIEWACKVIIKHVKRWAIKRWIPFDITRRNLLDLWNKQDGKCFYTGYNMNYKSVHENKWKHNDKSKMQVSVDRIDNNWSYNIKNIVLCCTFVNWYKKTMTLKELYKVSERIYKNKNIKEII